MRPTRFPVIASAVRSAPRAGRAASKKRAAPCASLPTGRNLGGMLSDGTPDALRKPQEFLPKYNESRPSAERAGLDVLSEGRVVRASLFLRPLLDVPGRALARRVVDEAADRRLVDEVGRPLEQRDHRDVGRHLLPDPLDQSEPLAVGQRGVGLCDPPGDTPVAVLTVVGRIPASEVRHVVVRVDRDDLGELARSKSCAGSLLPNSVPAGTNAFRSWMPALEA